jgi:dihydrofolate synthase/folylpolyglutamate synthase
MKQLDWPTEDSKHRIVMGLERMRQFMSLLGNPHQQLQGVIHIAGTNGKGSTAAFLESLLTAHGHTVNKYTSPHLVHWNERITLQGQPISDSLLLDYGKRCHELTMIYDISLSHFEALTVLAFLAFYQHPADFVILETGLGGRLDATNIIDRPLCTVITPIGLDHCEFLGTTLEKIAYEKSGIIKPNVPCIVSRQEPIVTETVRALGLNLTDELYLADTDYYLNNNHNLTLTSNKQVIEFTIPQPLLMPGSHQVENLALAVATLLLGAKLPISDKEITYAVSDTMWPARLQNISQAVKSAKEIFYKYDEIWLDVTHNADGAKSLSVWISSSVCDSFVIIVQLTRDRSYFDFLLPLIKTNRIVAVIVIDASPNDIERLQQLAQCDIILCSTLHSAYQLLVSRTHLHQSQVLFCGSHSLAGQILEEHSLR